MRGARKASPRHGHLVGLMVTYSMTSLILNAMLDDQHMLESNNFVQTDPDPNVCICLADNRFSERDLSLVGINSESDLLDFITEDPQASKDWGYWRKTAMINKIYALRHNYKLIMSDLSAYQSVFNESRSAVWLKPAFMLAMEHERLDCDWFAMMDSDAYFWMANHTVGLRDWFSTKSIHEATPRYQEYEEEKRRRHGYFEWNETEAFLLIGLNGVFSEPQEGYPNVYAGKKDDFMCAGVYFIRNSQLSKQFLRDWVYGPNDMSAEEHEAMDFYAHHFPFEQRVLNLVLFPRYKDFIHIHSYRDFGSKDGTMIRHVWSQFREMRSSLIEKDINILLGF